MNGVRSGKSTWKRGSVGSSCFVMAAKSTIHVLCKDDIPGASLAGRQPLHCVKFRNVITMQGAKKVVSDSPGLVDFPIGLADFPDKLSSLTKILES